jgi:hypothetical protein
MPRPKLKLVKGHELMGRRPGWRPRTFTSAEEMLDEVRGIMFADKRPTAKLAADVGVSPSTVNNIRTGKTRWPRQTTLFPLLDALGKGLRIVEKG